MALRAKFGGQGVAAWLAVSAACTGDLEVQAGSGSSSGNATESDAGSDVGEPTSGDSTSGWAPSSASSEGPASGSSGDADASTTDASSGSEGSTRGSDTTADDGRDSTSGTGTSRGATTDDESTVGAGTSGSDDGGQPPDPECPLACDPPCDLVLSEGLHAVTSVHHDGSRFVARDYLGKLILRDAATLDVLLIEHDTAWAEMTAGVLAVAYDDGGVLLRSSADLGVLGEAVTQSQRGLAIDGSYLWSLGPAGIDVLAVDGSPLWSMVGDFSDARVLALPESLHVFADVHADQSVLHVDLAGGDTDEAEFEGQFAGWFGDTPRFWSQQGMAYRLYEADGTELAFGLGGIAHGWGDYLVLNGGVVHVADVDTPLVDGIGGWIRRSGPALAFHGATSGILVLDPAGPQLQEFPTACCSPSDPYGWQFAWSPSGWVLGLSSGVVSDHLDRTTSLGPITRVDAAIGGRFALKQPGSATELWDVVPDCTVEPIGEIDLPGGELELSPDGTVVANGVPNPDFLANGYVTLLHGLPGGEEIGYFGSSGCSTCFIQSWSMSDNASIVGHMWSWTGAHTSAVFAVPSGMMLAGTNSNVMPAIAPEGAHSVVTDASWGPGATYEEAVAYVYLGDTFVDVFDGVAWGFVDDKRLLLSHYDSAGSCDDAGVCDTFLGMEIVELDGTVVQSTSLPDVRAFQRISSTEIFVTEPPRIYDVYTGELLWSMPDVAYAGAVTPDLVVWTDGASLVVHRWR